MRRVPEVLDCWFESGSMPFAQVHYPFENSAASQVDPTEGQGWFEHHYPGDFIVEYNGQTRGWFYTLHVLATALFDRPAFVTCMAHGIVLGDDGQKMSKSRRNYPDVGQVFERDGSDAMRWFLMSSAILRGADLVVTEAGIREGVRQAVLPLWNAWYFLALYARASNRVGRRRTESRDVLDRYRAVEDGRAGRGRHRPARRLRHGRRLRDRFGCTWRCSTNWYVRRSRQRFWDGDADAIDTLHTVLEHRDPGGRPAAAADHRGDLAWPDRRALGAPGRLAGAGRRRRPAVRRRARRGDGRDPRDRVRGAVRPQGRQAPRPAAAGVAHRRRAGSRGAAAVLGAAGRRGQRAGGAS